MSVVKAATAPTQYEVEAAFLLNFTKFIDWPSSSFASPSDPFRICIAGEDPFGDTLDKMVEGETVSSHKLAVARLHHEAPVNCQIIFVSKTERGVAELLSAVKTAVLTVGETESFLRQGGIIRFVLEENHVRFDVNQIAARRSGLTISSKLLNVARKVEGR